MGRLRARLGEGTALLHAAEIECRLRGAHEVFTSIQQHYVKPNPDGTKLTQGAASGMVGALGDQFSRYLTPDEYRANQSFLAGQFAGIGASVQQKGDQVVIAGVLPNTPAEKAGIKAGD